MTIGNERFEQVDFANRTVQHFTLNRPRHQHRSGRKFLSDEGLASRRDGGIWVETFFRFWIRTLRRLLDSKISVDQLPRTGDASFDLTFVRSEDADCHFDRQSSRKLTRLQALKMPNASAQGAPFDVAAIGPLLTDIDSLFGQLTFAV